MTTENCQNWFCYEASADIHQSGIDLNFYLDEIRFQLALPINL